MLPAFPPPVCAAPAGAGEAGRDSSAMPAASVPVVVLEPRKLARAAARLVRASRVVLGRLRPGRPLGARPRRDGAASRPGADADTADPAARPARLGPKGWAHLVLFVLVAASAAAAWQFSLYLQRRTDGLTRYVRVDVWSVEQAKDAVADLAVALARIHGPPAAGDRPILEAAAARALGSLRLLERAEEGAGTSFVDRAAVHGAQEALAELAALLAAADEGTAGAAAAERAAAVARVARALEELRLLAADLSHVRIELQDRDLGSVRHLLGLSRSLLAGVLGLGALLLGTLALEARAARRSELRAVANERRFRDFAEVASDWVWETDGSGRLTYTSPRLAEAVGLQPEALLGRRAEDLARLRPGLAPLLPWAEAVGRAAPFRDLVCEVRAEADGSADPGAGVDTDVRRIFRVSGRPTRDARGRPAGVRGVGTDITGEVERDARILHLATRDALTGLRNRASLADEAAVLLDALADERADAALLLIDLAGFREINETFGAEIGDALLREFACRMRALGAADGAAGGGGLLLARVGGDEFAVLLPRALDARRQAAELADGLKSAASNPFRLQGRELRAQIQVGVALFPQDGGGLDELLGAAGLALALAREGAGGTTSFFDPGIRLGMARRRSMEQVLRRAVEGGALHFALQPQAALADGALVGCEALLRWQDPELGPVRPDVFVPVAEETGLIQPIGYWLLEEACRAALSWPGRGRHATIAVNVSPLQLLDPGFVRGVEATLAVTGLPAGRLELEITEGVFVRDSEAVLATLNGLREMGVALAIDDFGTGYSSLGYLKRFPVAKLKIDRAFVKDLDESAGDRALTAAIVGVSRALGLKTVAEGIETEGQWRFLRDQGCDVGQGYLFGRPLTPEAFAALWAPRSAGAGTS